MPSPASTTLRRVRGCVAGGLAGVTAIGAHGIAGGGQPPSAAAIVLLVAACAAFGAVVSAARLSRAALFPLFLTIIAGQAVGHAALILGSPHTHHGLAASLSAGMLGAHAATAFIDVALIWLAESAAVWALALLHRLADVDTPALPPIRDLWVVASTPAPVAHGLLLASAAVTRGPPTPRFAL